MALPRISPGMSWSDEIAAAANEFFLEEGGELEVREPGKPGTYDPKTGVRTPATPGRVILSRRPGRAQHIRLPVDSTDGNGWQTRRRYRFQCDIRDGDEPITKGLLVRFFGGRDPEVPKMIFHVQWATNSSSAAVRTIEAMTEGARVNG